MSLTAEAIQKIEDLIRKAEPVVQVEDEAYATTNLTRVSDIKTPDEPVADVIEAHTLSSVATYLNDNPDDLDLDEVIITVEAGGYCVTVSSPLFGNRQREFYLSALPMDTIGNSHEAIKFGQFYDLETFNIKLRSWFVEEKNLVELLKVTENVRGEEIAEIQDDGMSQRVQVQAGVASVANAVIARRPALRPFRTFPEVEQPKQEFLLRLRKRGETMIEAGLFEADGGRWRLEASEKVAAFLADKIEAKVTIIS